MARRSLEWKRISAKPTNTVLCQPPCSTGPMFHKTLNWSVKHQTVITCGLPGEICKHPVCGVFLLPSLLLLSSLHHTKAEPCVDLKAKDLGIFGGATEWNNIIVSPPLVYWRGSAWTINEEDKIFVTNRQLAVCLFSGTNWEQRTPGSTCHGLLANIQSKLYCCENGKLIS